MPPHLLIVWYHRVGNSPKVGRKRLLVEVVGEDHLARVAWADMRMLHEILASQAALVTDRYRAVHAGLQEQLSVADAAARDRDVLRGIEVQLLRGA